MENLDYVEIGRKIRKARGEHSLSQEQLAEQCDISTSFLGHIERGTRKMSLETLVALSSVLELSTDYILKDELPDIDPVIFNIITSVKQAGDVQYKHYLKIITSLAKIADEL